MKKTIFFFYKLLLKSVLKKNIDLKEKYELIVAPYRKILQELPEISDNIAKDLTPVLLSGIKTVNALCADQELNQEAKIFFENLAKSRMDILKCYKDAGFSQEEAFKLMLSDTELSSK